MRRFGRVILIVIATLIALYLSASILVAISYTPDLTQSKLLEAIISSTPEFSRIPSRLVLCEAPHAGPILDERTAATTQT